MRFSFVTAVSIALAFTRTSFAQYLGLSVDQIFAANYSNGTANEQAVINFLKTGPPALANKNISQQWYGLQYDATPNEFAVLATFLPSEGNFSALPNLIMSAVDLGAANVSVGTPTLADITVLSSSVTPANVTVGLRVILVANPANTNDVAGFLTAIPNLVAGETFAPQWFATQIYNTTTSSGTNTFVAFLFAESYEQISYTFLGSAADIFNGAQSGWLLAQPDFTYYTVVASYDA